LYILCIYIVFYYIVTQKKLYEKVINKTKWSSYSKKRGPPTGIGGGGGGPLQVVPFIEDIVLIIKLKKYILLRKILKFI